MAIGQIPPDFLSSASKRPPKKIGATRAVQPPASTKLTNELMRSEVQGPTHWTEANHGGVEVEGHLGHRLNLLGKKEHPTPTPKCWQTVSCREDRPTVWMLLDVYPLIWTRSAIIIIIN